MDGVESADDVCGLVAGFGVSCSLVLLMVKHTVNLEVNRLVVKLLKHW